MGKSKLSVDVRVDPSEKATWQAEAEALGVSVSELVRSRMAGSTRFAMHPNARKELAALESDAATHAPLDLNSEELKPLRDWLALEDVDGEVDEELLAEWKMLAARSGNTFAELLEIVVLDANASLV